MSESNSNGKSALVRTKLTLLEGIALIVGANIGAGILSLAYGAKNAGWPVLVFWVIVAGILTTISMLYVAETTLRTKKNLQLSGLAEKYVGNLGSWLIFLSVAVNSLGALIAYTAGSGQIMAEVFGIPNVLGSFLFFIPAVGVIWLGLKAAGVAEKVITFGMLVLVLILILASVFGPGLKAEYLIYTNPKFAIPVFSLTVFAFLAQYIVPELSRGYDKETIKNLPRAIVIGMAITGILLTLVPMAALGLTGPDKVTEVVTIAWAEMLGDWAFFTANGFALMAMMTSFWALGQSYFTNIIDRFKVPSETNKKYRAIVLAVVAVPPFILAYSGFVGFVDALSIAGAFAGIIMAIVPVMMLNKSRKIQEKEPEWTCGKLAHPAIQTLIIALYTGAGIYTLLGIFNVLPKGW
ncbi:amino acid permease [Siminovitchia sp. FSL H7-0308]|uniref:Amino acid permease n=1 Tax=Siminovitchia thermophila TaxID=1245522 RepID=A0ABS2R857_9BACI|nr:amino acid permease [Siminovitchia thermophila]MBM7715033.1 amino acid permease [Siminovitchia thermophila]ONK23602.1 amino acid permease [Bacillus sp. VT-16-64]